MDQKGRPVSAMASDTVQVEWREEGVKCLYLNRPDIANAINQDLVADLAREIVKSYNDETKLLVIRGRGRHFCSGFDRSMMAQARREDHGLLGMEIEAMLQTVASAPFVTLAYVEGGAIGAGADLVVACDYRTAARDAKFAFPGFNLMGVSLGNSRLSQRIGPDEAMKMILQSRRIGAEEACRLGLVTQILDTAEAELFIDELAASVAAIPKAVVKQIKQSVQQGNSRSFSTGGWPGDGRTFVT